VTLSPRSEDMNETLSSLKFGSRVKKVEFTAGPKRHVQTGELAEMRAALAEAQQLISTRDTVLEEKEDEVSRMGRELDENKQYIASMETEMAVMKDHLSVARERENELKSTIAAMREMIRENADAERNSPPDSGEIEEAVESVQKQWETKWAAREEEVKTREFKLRDAILDLRAKLQEAREKGREAVKRAAQSQQARPSSAPSARERARMASLETKLSSLQDEVMEWRSKYRNEKVRSKKYLQSVDVMSEALKSTHDTFEKVGSSASRDPEAKRVLGAMGVPMRSRAVSRASVSADSSLRDRESPTTIRSRAISLAPIEKIKEAMKNVEEVRRETATTGLDGIRAHLSSNGATPQVLTNKVDNVRLPTSKGIRKGPTIPYGGGGGAVKKTQRPSSVPSRGRNGSASSSQGSVESGLSVASTPATRLMAAANGSSNSYARMAERRRSTSVQGKKNAGGISSSVGRERSFSSDTSAASSRASSAKLRGGPASTAYRKITLVPQW